MIALCRHLRLLGSEAETEIQGSHIFLNVKPNIIYTDIKWRKYDKIKNIHITQGLFPPNPNTFKDFKRLKVKDGYLYPVISGLAEAEQMKRTFAPSVTV